MIGRNAARSRTAAAGNRTISSTSASEGDSATSPETAPTTGVTTYPVCQPAEDLDRAGVESDLLVCFPQRGRRHILVVRLDHATRKGHLPGVVRETP